MTHSLSMPNRWIKYTNNKFMGSPQSKKGSGNDWIPVIYMGLPTSTNNTQHLVKDETNDICYCFYGPKGSAPPTVTVTTT